MNKPYSFKAPYLRDIPVSWVVCLILLLLLIVNLTACDVLESYLPATATQTAVNTPDTSPMETTPEAQITFRVDIPPDTPEDEQVFLDVLDEVTGLALNVKSYPMIQEQEGQFVTTVPFMVGSVVKYRYSRETASVPVEEHISDGRQVRYRLFLVQGPGEVLDHVSRWTDTPFDRATGRIMGQALDANTGQPIPNLLVAAGGAQTFTSADGSYIIEGLPPGTHNLVAYALDGKYRTFQQGAVVAPESTTPAPLSLNQVPLVNVNFEVTVPEITIPAVPIRLAGNLYQLGNTFADLSAGFSTLASRMPPLSPNPDFRYTLTLQLPVGADIRYLYTLGDGFWNAEKTSDGEVIVRQLIVPSNDTTITDIIQNWYSESANPVAFDINVPPSTPPGDSISIQFNPLIGWTEPLPAWKLGENRWVYVLNSPLNILDTLQYRVCRNDQCGSADDARTSGPNSQGFALEVDETTRTMDNQVDAWVWLDTSVMSSTYSLPEIFPRGSNFMGGIEFQPSFHPSWNSRIFQTFDDIQLTGSNWVILTPTWSFTRNSPPILELVPGRNPLWFDILPYIQEGNNRDLNIALKPSIDFILEPREWWGDGTRDFSWWLVWFEQYRNFILHHATMAARNDVQALIIDGSQIAPALPGSLLADGRLSGVPTDAESRWRALLAEIRSRFNGPIIWAMDYSQAIENPPPFIDAIDQVYIQFNEPLTANLEPSQAELEVEAARLFDTELSAVQAGLGKPLVIGVAFPSANGSATACLPDPENRCLRLEQLSRPNPDLPSISRDLQEQVDIYNALLSVINQREWITGFISSGYYPPAALQDKSSSIHGKPAEMLLGDWFSRIIYPR